MPISDREGTCVYQFDGGGLVPLTTAVPLATAGQAAGVIAYGGALLLATLNGVYRAAPGYALSPGEPHHVLV